MDCAKKKARHIAEPLHLGWGQLNDALKPSRMLGFLSLKVNLYPRLYPRFAFATFTYKQLPTR